jgi:peptide/nickel transport system substrate-binding protein
MGYEASRRVLLKGAGAGVASLVLGSFGRSVLAAEKDTVTIAWPSDVPSWDPQQRTAPDAQPLYKAVFDQPIEQNPDLTLRAHLAKSWNLSADGKTLELEFRDDVRWHDGSKLTAADFRYGWFERVQRKDAIDLARVWPEITDIQVSSPTRAVVTMSQAKPTALQWLAFMADFMVPRDYMEKVGIDGFREKPIGSGPYRVVEYQMNSRIVLERNEQYWGPKPKMRRVIIEIIKDSSARVAAVQSGKVDMAVNLPVREVERLSKMSKLAGELNPITRLILLQIRDDLGFADENVRLAVHHAIDKKALSKAFYNGGAIALSMVSTPGTPAYDASFKFAYDPKLAVQLLAKAGFSATNRAKIKLATTNGHFPSDFDMARAIVAMWKKVGIDAEIEVIEYSKYFELNRGRKLPEAMLYSWDNGTGDPEIFTGYLLHPKKPFTSWRGEDVGNRVLALESIIDYDKRVQAYRDLEKYAVEHGAAMPLLQSVQTVVRKRELAYQKYRNGLILPQFMSWK